MAIVAIRKACLQSRMALAARPVAGPPLAAACGPLECAFSIRFFLTKSEAGYDLCCRQRLRDTGASFSTLVPS